MKTLPRGILAGGHNRFLLWQALPSDLVPQVIVASDVAGTGGRSLLARVAIQSGAPTIKEHYDNVERAMAMLDRYARHFPHWAPWVAEYRLRLSRNPELARRIN